MDAKVAIALALAFSGDPAPSPTPPQPKVVASVKTPCINCTTCGANCPCFGSGYYCKDGQCPITFSEPKVVPPSYSFSYRQPHGHTHTDAAGHTWDHDANPSHNCTVPVPSGVVNGVQTYRACGMFQNQVDTPSRAVLVVHQTSSAVPVQTTAPQPVQQLFQFAPLSTGCANGSCGTSQRTGLFGRVR